MLPLRVRVDLGAMAMKGYYAFSKAPASMEPQHHIVLCHIQDTRWEGLAPLQRCSQCILQPQPTGQKISHHHHHVVLPARISLTLSRHFSLSFIASSGLHPVSSHSCWMYVRTGRFAFARPYVGVHRSTSLMSSSLLLQQCPACLVRLTWIVFVMGGRWPYSWCLVGLLLPELVQYKKKYILHIYIYIYIYIRLCF